MKDKDNNASVDKYLEHLWDSLEDVPVVKNSEMRTVIDCEWNWFCKGTDVEDIWMWFDRRHSKGVHYLMYERGN